MKLKSTKSILYNHWYIRINRISISLASIDIRNFTVTFALSENVRWHRSSSASHGNDKAASTCRLCWSFLRSMYDLSVVRRIRSTSFNASKAGDSLESRIFTNSSLSAISSASLTPAISFFWFSLISIPQERCHCTMWAIKCASTINGVIPACSRYLLSSVHIWPSFSRRYISMQHKVTWKKIQELDHCRLIKDVTFN